MPELRAYQHGICPRSERLVQATRDVERGRTTPEAVDEAFRADRQALLAVQREARLDHLSDGLLRWQDVFRPLVEASSGLEAQTLVRWFDNNSFFRAPRLADRPALDGLPPELSRDGDVPEDAVATLPSPYLFSRAAETTEDRDRVLGDLVRGVLRPAVEGLVGAGFRVIHLQEPWLPFFGVEDASWKPLEAGLAELHEASGDATLVFHTYFGDVAPHAERLRRLPVDAVGIDFVETDLDALPAPWGTGLLVGCLDGRRSLLESADGTAKFVEHVAEALQPPEILVSSTSDLELLPREVADRKIRLLGEVRARAAEALE
ncbi:MAG TPA: hypothetical protein VHL78_08970 [Actinomycetota bacterium]|nr:hypothetical protein [Actinomycetota bacterium]